MRIPFTPRPGWPVPIASATGCALLLQCLSGAAQAQPLLAAARLPARTTALAVNHLQDISVAGRVTQDNGEPLPGVTVLVKGTNNGVSTNSDGIFSLINVPENGTLVISSIGYIRQEISINGRTTIDVQLSADVEGLSDVVVIGYGTARRGDLTGAVASVGAKELTSYPTTNVVQALAGRAPGVQVIQNNGSPGAPVSVRIRGTNSIQGSSEPLYVIDGFPYSGNPSLLNNADIETIEILKDASATAIYGSRGANGVVIITTRKGKAGRTDVSYEGSFSSQSPRKKLELMNAREYGEFYNEQAKNDGVTPLYFTPAQIEGFTNTDWQDEIFRTAPMQSHSLSVNGGNEKTRFSVGTSLFQQEGIIKKSNFDRYSVRLNLTHDISPKFSFSYDGAFSRTQNARQGLYSGTGPIPNRGAGLMTAAISAPPSLSPYLDNGTYRPLTAVPGYPFLANVLINPLNFIHELTDVVRANLLLTNAAVTYKPFNGLSVRVSGGVESNEEINDQYRTRQFIGSAGVADINSSRYLSLLNENVATYVKEAGLHSITVTGGFTYQDFRTTRLNASGSGFINDALETYDLGAATLVNTPSTAYSKAVLLSWLGRVNYAFHNRYLLTATFRTDGSSRYSEGQKWGQFPSAALAWKVKEESFLQGVNFLSDLKLRVGFGLTGSQAIAPYSTLTLLNPQTNPVTIYKTVFDDALVTTYAPGTALAAPLKWETTRQTDFGLDAAVLDGRLSLTADYYIKDTYDLLNSVQLPSSLGYRNTIRNVGEVQNKGLELALNASLVKGTDKGRSFGWNLGANIAFNRNKVVKLYNNQDIAGPAYATGLTNDYITRLREGQPLGVFYGYQEAGYNEQGNITYKNLTPDKDPITGADIIVINEADKTVIGNPNPDFIYGLNSAMTFRGFELTAFFQGSQGNDIFNLNAVQSVDLGFGLNQLKEQYNDHWTPENREAKYPKVTRLLAANMSDRFVEDGSYLRLKNVQLAYTLPTDKFGVEWLRNIQVYVSGQNLLTLTKYSWYDPEVNTYGGSNSFSQGIDHFSYPTAKAVTAGIRIGL